MAAVALLPLQSSCYTGSEPPGIPSKAQSYVPLTVPRITLANRVRSEVLPLARGTAQRSRRTKYASLLSVIALGRWREPSSPVVRTPILAARKRVAVSEATTAGGASPGADSGTVTHESSNIATPVQHRQEPGAVRSYRTPWGDPARSAETTACGPLLCAPTRPDFLPRNERPNSIRSEGRGGNCPKVVRRACASVLEPKWLRSPSGGSKPYPRLHERVIPSREGFPNGQPCSRGISARSGAKQHSSSSADKANVRPRTVGPAFCIRPGG